MTVPSAPPVATSCPSGDHITAKTDAACPVSVSRARPLLASHTLAVPSLLPVVRSVVSGDQETKLTGPVCPSSLTRSKPVFASDILAVASAPPVAKKRPSGDHEIELIGPTCPASWCRSCRLSRSQTIAVASRPAVASSLPSGDQVTELTQSMCCARVRSSRPLEVTHTLVVPSQLAVAINAPSGDHAAQVTGLVCPFRARRSRPVEASQTLAVPSILAVATSLPSGDQATDLTWGAMSNQCVLFQVAEALPVAPLKTSVRIGLGFLQQGLQATQLAHVPRRLHQVDACRVPLPAHFLFGRPCPDRLELGLGPRGLGGRAVLMALAAECELGLKISSRRDRGDCHEEREDRRGQSGDDRVPPAPAQPRSATFTRRARLGRPSRNRWRSSASAVGGRVPAFRLPRDRRVYDRLQVIRHMTVELAQPGRLFLRYLEDQARWVALLKRRTPCEQLVQGQPQSVDIGRVSAWPRNRSGAM